LFTSRSRGYLAPGMPGAMYRANRATYPPKPIAL